MKYFFIGFILLLSGQLYSQAGTIELHVNNIDSSKGHNIVVSLFNEGGYFKIPIFVKSVLTTGTSFVIKLEDITVGKYALTIYQDENSDNEMNTYFYGRPKERSGFSNNAKGWMGPPHFEDASFVVVEGKTTMVNVGLK